MIRTVPRIGYRLEAEDEAENKNLSGLCGCYAHSVSEFFLFMLHLSQKDQLERISKYSILFLRIN